MTEGHERDAAETDGRTDPTAIRSVAVTVDDVVTALEARRRSGRPTVLRVTPPFAGRMRARLHVEGTEAEYDSDPEPIHLPPANLIADDAPAYPEVDETADELRAEGAYSPESHRERHVGAVEAWRESVRAAVRDRVELETPAGSHEVEVKRLG